MMMVKKPRRKTPGTWLLLEVAVSAAGKFGDRKKKRREGNYCMEWLKNTLQEV